MSGGRFDYINNTVKYEMEGKWHDVEMNEMFYDLFCAPLWGSRDGGVATALDFWLSGDVDESTYREYVQKFKEKWFGRTPEKQLEAYQEELQRQCDRLKKEMAGESCEEEF